MFLSIVYTIPISLLRDKEIKPFIETETNDQVITMPVVKLLAKEDSRKPNAIPRQEVMDTLCETLSWHIPDHLLERSTAEKLILYSGGLLRELIRIANECCRICLQLIRRRPDRTDIKITDEILEQAVNNIRNDFALRLDKKDYAILQQVYQNFMPEDPAEPLYGRSLEICEQQLGADHPSTAIIRRIFVFGRKESRQANKLAFKPHLSSVEARSAASELETPTFELQHLSEKSQTSTSKQE